uniref:Uncharacterized protein n=1 Tax=Cyprinus carpio TaxID=7962 RepID=A0A8C1VB09_CYPCA
MLLYTLFIKLDEIWTSAECKQCLIEDQDALSNDTLYYVATLNQSLSCFEQYLRNHTELCKGCKTSYRRLNEVYGTMERNQMLCIDLEDAVIIIKLSFKTALSIVLHLCKLKAGIKDKT